CGTFGRKPQVTFSVEMKRAFITGIEGQDGSYLAELLLGKEYEVHGLYRHATNGGAVNLRQLKADDRIFQRTLFLHPGDLDDVESLRRALEQAAPDEVYHLASQSHVGQSFEHVEDTCRITGMGTLRLLELVRKLPQPAKFFHASSSEIFGSPEQAPQDENAPVAPITPYGCAKAFGTQMTRVYRKNFGLFAVNGILFNHESPRRGENFVSRKICRAVAAIKAGRQKELILGDTGAQRDWGHACDYVRGMWLSLQHIAPEDFVFATGKVHRVQDIVEIAFHTAGLDWHEFVRQEKQFFRPADPRQVVGNADKAKRLLGWEPEIPFEQIVAEMTQAELRAVGA
ncbi:MAG TPA: GDP-mannose 4,6-dehydratase, partial [Verrucomicrobiae bacterium]